MVRRSFSNPFLRVFSRRRSKNDDDKEDVSNHRKESVDHTVLSGDDSRFNRSVTSADGFVPSHVPYPNTGTNPSPALRRASQSDPSIISTSSPPTEHCMCCECMSRDPYLQTNRNEFANTYVRGPSPPYQPQQQQFVQASPMYTGQEFAHPPSNSFERDPTLQARIEAVEIQQRLLGEHHPDVIFALSSLAKLCQKRGDFEGALSIMRESQVRSMQAKTLAYEQQVSRIQQQQEIARDGVLVPTEISFNSFRH